MKINLILLFALISVLGCKKDRQSTEGEWTLKNYSVTYYNQAGDKVFESKPDELLQFNKIEISGDSISFPIAPQAVSVRGPIKTNPASLVFLNAKKTLNGVSLNFQTASEVNVSHWIIERSGTGEVFSAIAQIIGGDTTNTVNNYSFKDYDPLFGNNYYRLKQVDFDGKSAYSSIVKISMNFSLSIVNGKISLPVDLIDHTFKKVAITFKGNSKMVWSGEAENCQYTENGVIKTAASAKLNLEFIK